MMLGKLDIHMQKRNVNKIELDPYHIKKINSKWIKDIYVRAKTIKFLEKNVREENFSL